MAITPTATNTFLIPLSPQAQQFVIALGGINYQLTFKWNNAQDAGWIMDIADSTGNPIAVGIPLTTWGDLLSGLEYLGIPGSFYVLTNGSNLYDVPTLTNLGIDSNLYFVSAVSS